LEAAARGPTRGGGRLAGARGGRTQPQGGPVGGEQLVLAGGRGGDAEGDVELLVVVGAPRGVDLGAVAEDQGGAGGAGPVHREGFVRAVQRLVLGGARVHPLDFVAVPAGESDHREANEEVPRLLRPANRRDVDRVGRVARRVRLVQGQLEAV